MHSRAVAYKYDTPPLRPLYPMLKSLLFAILLIGTSQVWSAPKIALVLGGGGTKGGAHVGVIRALEERGIKVDYVVGTSVGAIIGAMYAVGLSSHEIEAAIRNIDWDNVLDDAPKRATVPIQQKRGDFDYLVGSKPGFSGGELKLPLGISEGQKVTLLLRQLLQPVAGIRDFDQLPIPFRAIATSLETGDSVVLSKGDLPLNIRASMSIPGIFSPVKIEDQYLVDGGISNNLPIDVARQMGADVVIAVDIGDPLLKHDELNSVIGVSEQIINIMTRRNADEQIRNKGPDDIVIRPAVRGLGVLDFEKILVAIQPGYEAANAYADALSKWGSAISANAPAPKQGTGPENPIIQFVTLENNSGLAKQAILSRLDIPLGQPFDRERVEQGITRLYGSGLYQRIDYEIIQRNGDTGILMVTEAKSWGPNYLQFGLQLEEDFAADAEFNLGAAYVRTAINDLGGEWRSQLDIGARQGISTEWFQPLNYSGRFFSRLSLGYERNDVRVFDQGGSPIADIKLQEVGLAASLGMQTGRSSEAELSWRRLNGRADEFVGQITVLEDQFDVGEVSASFRYDTLNRTNRPTSGSLLRITALASAENIGGSSDYEQIHLTAIQAFSIGQTQMAITGIAGATIDNNAPIQSVYVLGGLGRLSGHPTDRFSGQNIAFLRGNLSHTLNKSSLGVFVGASLEYGSTYDRQFFDGAESWNTAGSIYAGLDTVLGPAYLAVGLAENADHSIYLSVGNPFVAKPIRPFD